MFQEKGKVIAIGQVQTGTSPKGEWNKVDFVIETSDQYPKKINFTLFAGAGKQLFTPKVGADVEVSFSIESREYNGKWFSNINAFRVDPVQAGAIPAQQTAVQAPVFEPLPIGYKEGDSDLPF